MAGEHTTDYASRMKIDISKLPSLPGMRATAIAALIGALVLIAALMALPNGFRDALRDVALPVIGLGAFAAALLNAWLAVAIARYGAAQNRRHAKFQEKVSAWHRAVSAHKAALALVMEDPRVRWDEESEEAEDLARKARASLYELRFLTCNDAIAALATFDTLLATDLEAMTTFEGTRQTLALKQAWEMLRLSLLGYGTGRFVDRDAEVKMIKETFKAFEVAVKDSLFASVERD